jgi:pSer/pThr/pTyr-binding forkhead associated (FHA) protein
LTDLGSTNGTYVEGERLSGEVPLGPGTTLRFGEVSALFEPLDEMVPAPVSNSTRTMPRIAPEASEPSPVRGAAVPQPDPAPPREPNPAPAPQPLGELPQPRPRPRRPIHAAPPRPKSPSTLTVVGLLILLAILAYLVSIN